MRMVRTTPAGIEAMRAAASRTQKATPTSEVPPAVAAVEAIEKVRSAFQQRSHDEEERRKAVTDSEYWVAFCFETREQKEAFLRHFSLLDDGDKYVDGLAAAEAMGVELDAPRLEFREPRGLSPKLAKLL